MSSDSDLGDIHKSCIAWIKHLRLNLFSDTDQYLEVLVSDTVDYGPEKDPKIMIGNREWLEIFFIPHPPQPLLRNSTLTGNEGENDKKEQVLNMDN